MVLTEAFAAGVPVIASNIPGYAGVVDHGVEGVLVAPGDPGALASAVLELAYDLPRRQAMSAAAGVAAQRFAWPHVTAQVIAAYEDAIAMPAPGGVAARIGLRARDQTRASLPHGRRLPSLEPARRARLRESTRWAVARSSRQSPSPAPPQPTSRCGRSVRGRSPRA